MFCKCSSLTSEGADEAEESKWPCYISPLYLSPMILLTAILSMINIVCTVSIYHVAAHINPNIKSLTLLLSKYASRYDLEN